MIIVSRQEAKAALQRASEQATLAALQFASEEFTAATQAAVAEAAAELEHQLAQQHELEDELQWHRDAPDEERAKTQQAAQQRSQELAVVQATLVAEVQDLESIIEQVAGASHAAEKALQARISALQQQLGGGNWLSAVGTAKQSAADALRDATKATALAKELQDLVSIGPRLRTGGESLLGELGSEAATRAAGHHDLLDRSLPTSAAEVGLT